MNNSNTLSSPESNRTNGLSIFTSEKKKDRASRIANSYVFETHERWFVIDTSCGKERRKELKSFLKDKKKYTILCTHYHNDHIANNWHIAGKHTKIIYHEKAGRKLPYLRTNSTGQILAMYNSFSKKDFLTRLGFFSKKTVNLLAENRILSRFFVPPLLFVTAYIISFKNTGLMLPASKKILFLKKEDQVDIALTNCTLKGWVLADNLYAFETPGHTDCHIAIYNSEINTLFCGDSLNFLNPNDIQFGEIDEVFKTLDFIINLTLKEKISTLASGHYHPIEGEENIIEYIKDIKKRHTHIFNLIKNEIEKCSSEPDVNELYFKICQLNDPAIKRLKKITFPVSTLVFLDVFVYKLMKRIKK